MDYKYHELEYAELIYSKGFQSTHYPTELRLLATYMRRVLGYRPKLLRQEMYNFCDIHFPGFSKPIHYKMLNKAINQACEKNSTLISISDIDIYKWEFNFINDYPLVDNDGEEVEFTYECRKLMFTLLVQMKLNQVVYEQKNKQEYVGKYFQGGRKKYSKLKQMANLQAKIKINEDIIYNLSRAGAVTIMFGGLIQLNFLEEMGISPNGDSITDEDIAFKIKNFENVGWYFDYYNHQEKMILCERCQRPVKQGNNRQKYCRECAEIMHRENSRISMQNLRAV